MSDRVGGQETDLATQLRDWTITEMQIPCQGSGVGSTLPTPEELRALCRGPSAAIWRWVVANVRSAEFVRTVRGNLAINRSAHTSYTVKYGAQEKFAGEKQDLLNQRAALSRDVTATLRDVGHLEHEIERVGQDLTTTEHEYQKQAGLIADTRRKAALIEAFSRQVADTQAQYQEFTRCISSRVDDIKARARRTQEPEEFYSRETAGAEEEEGRCPALETACSRNVRETCQDIGGFLQETLKGTFGGDKAEFDRRKAPLWRNVENVTRQYSSDRLLHALLAVTQDSVASVKEMTDRVDIRRDAQKLRFKYDSAGGMTDLATPPSLLRSVHQLLEDRTAEHLQRYLCRQKHSNQLKALEPSLKMLQAKIDKRLQDVCGKRMAALHLAKDLVETEVQLEGCKAALHFLTAEADRLTAVVQQSLQERQELLTKHHKIQDFRTLTDKKQQLIQVLVRQNINSQSRLDAQISEICQFVGKPLQSHRSASKELTARLQDSMDAEIRQFATLSLPYLMFSTLNSALKMAVIDLSIHQMSPVTIRPALQAVLECLNFPPHQAPENLLRRCLLLKTEMEDAADKLKSASNSRQILEQQDKEKDIAMVIADLCNSMLEQDRRQLGNALPPLQQKVTKTASVVADCLSVKDTVKFWWEQPGQSCVPWVLEGGHSLQYYKEQWTVLATSLRRLLVH